MTIIILGNAGLNVVSLDPLTQPLHRAVAVEGIRSQGPDHCIIMIMITILTTMMIIMEVELRLLMMMTKWSVSVEWVCAKGPTTRVFIMESRLIYSLHSPYSRTCTHTLLMYYTVHIT